MTTELLGDAAGELLALMLFVTTVFCLFAKVAMKSRLGDQDMPLGWESGGQTLCTEVSPLGYSPSWSHRECTQHARP